MRDIVNTVAITAIQAQGALMSAQVLVVNAGSSSLKYSLVDAETGEAAASGLVERIGESLGSLEHTTSTGSHTSERAFATFEDALRAAVDAFEEHGPSLRPRPRSPRSVTAWSTAASASPTRRWSTTT